MGNKQTLPDYPLLQLRGYVAAVEAFIAKSGAALPLTHDERIRLRQEPEAELEFEVGYETFIETCDVFPEILRRSVFVFVLTFLESHLNNFCLRLQRRLGVAFSVYDLQGHGIERSAFYIQRVAGVNIKQSRHWQTLQSFRKVRDALVHSNGKIRAEQFGEAAAVIVEAHPLMDLAIYEPSGTVDRYGVIQLRKGLCEEGVDCVEAFLAELTMEIEARVGSLIEAP